jgi:hypothetical protein
MSLAVRLAADPVRSVSFAVLGAVYHTLGGPMTHPIRILVFQNFTDTAVMVSFDGINDHLALTINSYFILDISANKTMAQQFYLAERQQLYVKQLGAAPTSGSVYVSVFYGVDV